MASCVWFPSTPEGVPYRAFQEYKKTLGYKTAWDVFKYSLADDYQEKYKDTLALDEQGAPSLESTLKTPFMKKFLKKDAKRQADYHTAGFTQRDNTLNNYNIQMADARRYNAEDHEFLAVVKETPNGKLEIQLVDRTPEALAQWNDEISAYQLTQDLLRIFEPLGVTVGMLTGNTSAFGVTDFSKAKRIAGQFRDLIRVANNRQGALAMTEEFAHLIVRIARDEPQVQRALDALKSDPTTLREILGDEFDEYADIYGTENFDDIAEEALGKSLVKALQKEHQQQQPVSSSYISRLIDRVITAIKRLFRPFNEEQVTSAIRLADQVSSDLAKRVLNNPTITVEDVEKTQASKQFYRLANQGEKLKKALNEAMTNELKKRKIIEIRQDDTSEVDSRIRMLDALLDDNGDPTALGVIQYLSAAHKEIQQRMAALEDMRDEPEHTTEQQKFKELRRVRDTIQSYDSFLTDLKRAIETEMLDDSLIEYNMQGQSTSLKELLMVVNDMNQSLKGEFSTQAFNTFLAYLKPFFGDIKIKAKDGNKYILEELLAEAKNGDITAFDDWLTSMGQSKDVVGQLFNLVVQKAKARARQTAIDEFQEIKSIQAQAQELGITDMDWLYERDAEGRLTGNYVSEVDYGKFRSEVKAEQQRLNDKYGETPSTAADAAAKAQEWRDWRSVHCSNTFGAPKPNKELYRNKWFVGLDDNDPHKILYNAVMKIKKRCDDRAFVDTGDSRMIQRRKSSDQRFFDTLTFDPKKLWNNIRESVENDLLVKEDDLEMAGISRSLTDFEGSEMFVVQMPYVKRLKDPEELSTDIWGTLAAYAYSSANCHEMRMIQNPLEVGYIVATEQRGYPELKSKNRVVEMVDKAGNRFIEAKTPGANFAHKLRAMLDTQLYGRHLAKDNTFKVFGKEVSTNKVVSKVLGWSSTSALGFNWLNDFANIVNGIAMTNIEAAGRRYFKPKDLAKADLEYEKALKDFIPDLNRPFKQSKLALFDQELDVKQDFTQKVHGNRSSKLISKIFNTNISFLTQDAGNHWLYNRVAIAMAIKEKIFIDGVETSLWDALTVKEENGKYKLVFTGVAKDANGNILGRDYLAAFGLKVAQINKKLFGEYSKEDLTAAQRTNIGRLLLAFRKWMVPLFRYRFAGRQYNVILQEDEEGIYVSVSTLFKRLAKSPTELAAVWNSLDDLERENCFRALVEFAQFSAVALLVTLFGFGKGDDGPDKDRIWIMRFAEYMANREFHELGNLFPSPVMAEELLKTVQSPFAAASHAANLLRFAKSCICPWEWNNEIKSGPYKGMSSLHKNALKSPIPFVSHYRNVDKFMDKLEQQTLFYSKKF